MVVDYSHNFSDLGINFSSVLIGSCQCNRGFMMIITQGGIECVTGARYTAAIHHRKLKF
jgi:hypothetical protein